MKFSLAKQRSLVSLTSASFLIGLMASSSAANPTSKGGGVSNEVDRGPKDFVGPPDSIPGRFQSFVTGLTYEPGPLDGNFQCSQGCGPNGTIHLMVWTVVETGQADWVTTLTRKKPSGYVLAKIKNVDGKRFDDLGLAPGESAYEWIGQLKTGDSRRAIAFYKEGSAPAASNIISQFTYCSDATASRFRSARLNVHHAASDCWLISGGQDVPASTEMRPFPLNGIWTSCSGGCCQVQQGGSVTGSKAATKPRKTPA
jgi:hypothetical protein